MIERMAKGLDVQLSPHISSDEIECQCGDPRCTALFYSTDLLKRFEKLRSIWDEPLTVNSGHRCCLHNFEVAGAKLSVHQIGMALDLTIPKTIDMFWFAHEAAEIFEFVYLYEDSRSIHLDVFERG